MNKDEALKHLAAMRRSVDDCKGLWDGLDKVMGYIESIEEPKATTGEFRVKPGEEQSYYRIDNKNKIYGKNGYYVESRQYSFGDIVSGADWDSFNCFLSEEKAELECRRRNAWLKLRQLEEEWAERHGYDDDCGYVCLDITEYGEIYHKRVPHARGMDCYFIPYGGDDKVFNWIKDRMRDMLDDLFLVVLGN